MYLFFEEAGDFKAGTVLKKDGTNYQVELTTGRRCKVKANHVFFEFESPAAATFLTQAQEASTDIDPMFLWEVAPDEEFGYESIAAEYFSSVTAVEKGAALMALHANPVYFYRKGRGNYKKAPEDILQRALQAVERKRQEEERRKNLAAQMVAGELPQDIAGRVYELLLKPDKNSTEWKALNDAASEVRMSPLRLIMKLGAVPDAFTWHVESFYRTNFPKGKGFTQAASEVPAAPGDLPEAAVEAFSVDDSSTTEIDDAASVTHLDGGRSRVGIHIAAPALIMPRGSVADESARSRMSTVYAPGMKTTMLPESWIERTSLDEGKCVPCVSLYVTVDDETMAVQSTETRVEKITVKHNLRYDLIHEEVTPEAIENGTLTVPCAHEIGFLWRFAKARLAEREERRGRPEQTGRIDWYLELEGEGENLRIIRKGRARGEPLDLMVAELMIFANSTWGLWLEECKTAGIYRSQRMGRVRMSTSPGPHDGLGVVRYAWSTSPLRRYVDLVNQRQIICAAAGTAPAYMGNDSDFYTIVSQFESVYEAYSEFQRKMERFWSLKWIEQEGLKEIEAVVIKGDLVRVEGLPLVQRIPGMPELDRGRKVLLGVLGFDYIDVLFEGKLLAVLDETDEEALEEGDGLEDESQTSEESQTDKTAEQNEPVTGQPTETACVEPPNA